MTEETFESSVLVTVSLDDIQELLEDLEDFENLIERRFNRAVFRRIRRRTGTQTYWADKTGVSQATIGNWERGYTFPNAFYRKSLSRASQSVRSDVVEAFRPPQGDLVAKIDIAETSRALRSSIISAALTDFTFDPSRGMVVPIPFQKDFDADAIEAIQQDRDMLLEALGRSAEIIEEALGSISSNVEPRVLTYLRAYGNEVKAESPNPRLLNRLGATVSRVLNDGNFRQSAHEADTEAVDGFVRDHTELMRLYFREALAKAQEIEREVVDDLSFENSEDEFEKVAQVMDSLVSEQGHNILDKSIATLLRDIAAEIRALSDSILLTNDMKAREIYKRRQAEAVKNGRVYVGRFVFFSALLVSVGVPALPEALDALARIVGLTERTRPGSVRSQYEQMQQSFPALPSIPELDS